MSHIYCILRNIKQRRHHPGVAGRGDGSIWLKPKTRRGRTGRTSRPPRLETWIGGGGGGPGEAGAGRAEREKRKRAGVHLVHLVEQDERALPPLRADSPPGRGGPVIEWSRTLGQHTEPITSAQRPPGGPALCGQSAKWPSFIMARGGGVGAGPPEALTGLDEPSFITARGGGGGAPGGGACVQKREQGQVLHLSLCPNWIGSLRIRPRKRALLRKLEKLAGPPVDIGRIDPRRLLLRNQEKSPGLEGCAVRSFFGLEAAGPVRRRPAGRSGAKPKTYRSNTEMNMPSVLVRCGPISRPLSRRRPGRPSGGRPPSPSTAPAVSAWVTVHTA